MSTSTALRLPVADLLRRPGATRPAAGTAELDDLATATVRAAGPVAYDLVLERIPEGIVARGEVRVAWESDCSRCLAPVRGDAVVHVDELFELEPVEGETYRLDHDAVDLEPMVRDAILLDVPATPHCRPDCRGLCPECGADRNLADCGHDHHEPDPRWAALGSLDS